MASWTVTRIIDGDTFEVTPTWQWQGQEGNRVRPKGFDAPEVGTPGAHAATQKLADLILNEQVELHGCVRVHRGRLVCDVFCGGVDIANLV